MARTSRRSRRYSPAPLRRKRPQNVSFHKIITSGSTILEGPDNVIAANNILNSAEAAAWYGKDLGTRGNAIVGLRGNWWWWTDASADLVQSVGSVSVGLIAENVDVSAQLDTEGERAQVGPLDVEGRYRPWHYRRTVPVINRQFAAGQDVPGFDQAHQIMLSRQGIGATRAEKFLSVRDSYFLYAQTSAEYQVGLAWQIQFFVREP